MQESAQGMNNVRLLELSSEISRQTFFNIGNIVNNSTVQSTENITLSEQI
jgi:glutaminase